MSFWALHYVGHYIYTWREYMSIGNQLQHAFLMVFKRMSGTIQVHKNYGLPNQSTIEMSGLKNNEKNRPSKVT
jgi:hypothetical protein